VSSSQLNTVNAIIRELIDMLDEVKGGRDYRNRLLRKIDEVENAIDSMVQILAPERITDERFSAAVSALKDLADKFKTLREAVIFGKFSYAKKLVLEIQESIRHTFRLLTLIRAGAPTTLIFQVTPQFLREVKVPESVLYSNPMAAQIYSILVKKGEASIDELAMDLKVDKEKMEDFNRAVATLISTGHVTPFFTPEGKMLLKLVGR